MFRNIEAQREKNLHLDRCVAMTSSPFQGGHLNVYIEGSKKEMKTRRKREGDFRNNRGKRELRSVEKGPTFYVPIVVFIYGFSPNIFVGKED